MSMSEKDKNTLIIAAIALLIVGIAILGIKPAFTGIQEAKALKTELSATKETMKTEIDALPTYKTNLETAKTEYQATAARVFNDAQTNDLVHDEVLALATDTCGLKVSSFSVSQSPETGIAYYSTETLEGGVQSTAGTINTAQVTVGVYGTTAQLINFIELLNTTEGTFLQSVSFSTTAEGETSVSVSFYMILGEAFA